MSAVVGAVCGLFVSGSAFAAGPFDGAWTISETCPPTQTDVRGYTWTYAGTVRNGMLSASYQVKWTPWVGPPRLVC